MQPLVRLAMSLLVGVKAKDGYFLAICPYLNVVSRGDTKDLAIQHLIEEVEFLFEACTEDGSLGALLNHRESLGIQLPPAGELVAVERASVTLPLGIPPELLERLHHHAAAAA